MKNWFRLTREAGPAKGNEKGQALQRSFCEQTAVSVGGGSKPPSPALSRRTAALILAINCDKLRVTR